MTLAARVSVALLLLAAGSATLADSIGIVDYHYRIVARYSHPAAPFTQGLIAGADGITETSGGYAVSYIQHYVPGATGAGSRQALPRRWFAEGLARIGERLWVLTWHAGTALVLDADSFATVKRLFYQGEGWGLASDGRELVMSDGSATLTFRRPSDFSVIRRLQVTLDGKPVQRLNELEWVRGWILANVWLTDTIVVIDPHSGAVRGRFDLAALKPAAVAADPDAVANGIAYDGTHLFVTGKRWPVLYEIVPEPALPSAGTHRAVPIE